MLHLPAGLPTGDPFWSSNAALRTIANQLGITPKEVLDMLTGTSAEKTNN